MTDSVAPTCDHQIKLFVTSYPGSDLECSFDVYICEACGLFIISGELEGVSYFDISFHLEKPEHLEAAGQNIKARNHTSRIDPSRLI